MKDLNKYLDSIQLASNLICVSLKAVKMVNAPLIDLEPIEGTLQHAIRILDEVLDLCNQHTICDTSNSFRKGSIIDQND